MHGRFTPVTLVGVHGVADGSLKSPTCPIRLAARTQGSQPCNRGSIPLSGAGSGQRVGTGFDSWLYVRLGRAKVGASLSPEPS